MPLKLELEKRVFLRYQVMVLNDVKIMLYPSFFLLNLYLKTNAIFKKWYSLNCHIQEEKVAKPV